MSGGGKAWSSPGCVYAGGVADQRMWAPVCASCGQTLICAAGPALLAPALSLLPASAACRIESRHLAQIEHPAFSGCPLAYPDHTDRLYHVTPSCLCPLLWSLLSPSSRPSYTLPSPVFEAIGDGASLAKLAFPSGWDSSHSPEVPSLWFLLL